GFRGSDLLKIQKDRHQLLWRPERRNTGSVLSFRDYLWSQTS
ncbi:unnamed protein product, partial [Ectocarpus sp. 13 AM-2016]